MACGVPFHLVLGGRLAQEFLRLDAGEPEAEYAGDCCNLGGRCGKSLIVMEGAAAGRNYRRPARASLRHSRVAAVINVAYKKQRRLFAFGHCRGRCATVSEHVGHGHKRKLILLDKERTLVRPGKGTQRNHR